MDSYYYDEKSKMNFKLECFKLVRNLAGLRCYNESHSYDKVEYNEDVVRPIFERFFKDNNTTELYCFGYVRKDIIYLVDIVPKEENINFD